MSRPRRGAPTPGHGMGRRIPGTLLTDLTNRIEVVSRSGKRSGRGHRHVLPLRPGYERDLDWQKALCGACPRSGWTEDAQDAPWCESCQHQLDVEAEVAAARVWTADELFRSAQVGGTLRDEIQSGVFLPGRQFLTHAEVEARFGVSRSTVRRVWDGLKAQGLIVTEHHGTYVAPHAARSEQPDRDVSSRR